MYFDLALVNVDFRELVSNGELLGWMTLASHMGEYFRKTLVLEQWGYEKCTEMQICCWNRLFEGTLLRLAFSPLCVLSGAGCLVGIVDYTSVYVAHVAVPAEKLWFLGKSK